METGTGLKLTTWQRMVLSNIIGTIEGNVAIISKAGKLYDILTLNDEESRKVNLRASPGGQVLWDNSDLVWELEIPDEALLDFLRERVGQYNRWPVTQLTQVLDLYDQLGMEIPS